MRSIPESVGSCTFLREINLSQNKIQKIPDSIGKLNWLLRLDLSKNSLDHLPHNIGKWSRLKELNLEFNQLTTLPDSLKVISALHYLLLKGNPMELTREYVLKFGKLQKLTGLGSLLSSNEKRQLLSFLKHCRRLKIPEAQRIDFYHLMTSDKRCAKPTLLQALNFPVQAIREKALDQWFQYYNPSQPITDKSIISFTGRSKLNKKRIISQLTNLGLTYEAKISKNTSHIILSAFPNQTALLKAKSTASFLREQEFQAFLSNQEAVKEKEFSEKAIKNLSRLLLSKQEDNISIAVQILKNATVPLAIITELFLASKSCKTTQNKRQLKALLYLNTSKTLQQHLSSRLRLANDLPDTVLERNIDYYVNGTELEKEKIMRFFKD